MSYSQEQWERPAPDDTWSDEDFEAWEKRNPSWALQEDLPGSSFDSDFVETIFGPDKVDYLETQLKNEADRQHLRSEIPVEADTLVLIMSAAFDGKQVSLSSTPKLRYHGEYRWNL
ncbi:MAG: hypothetical protein EOP84_09290 [Verrucomicrobiaceae bacterium]|nr:MAG: hypothetical protein EOP84_09290 [Verrucomicrobiaceae bacterium]